MEALDQDRARKDRRKRSGIAEREFQEPTAEEPTEEPTEEPRAEVHRASRSPGYDSLHVEEIEQAQREAHIEIQDALEHLSDEERRIIELYDIEGLTLETVGKILGVNASTVWRRRQEALTKLREIMGGAT